MFFFVSFFHHRFFCFVFPPFVIRSVRIRHQSVIIFPSMLAFVHLGCLAFLAFLPSLASASVISQGCSTVMHHCIGCTPPIFWFRYASDCTYTCKGLGMRQYAGMLTAQPVTCNPLHACAACIFPLFSFFLHAVHAGCCSSMMLAYACNAMNGVAFPSSACIHLDCFPFVFSLHSMPNVFIPVVFRPRQSFCLRSGYIAHTIICSPRFPVRCAQNRGQK